jgi:hypothetical protein
VTSGVLAGARHDSHACSRELRLAHRRSAAGLRGEGMHAEHAQHEGGCHEEPSRGLAHSSHDGESRGGNSAEYA